MSNYMNFNERKKLWNFLSINSKIGVNILNSCRLGLTCKVVSAGGSFTSSAEEVAKNKKTNASVSLFIPFILCLSACFVYYIKKCSRCGCGNKIYWIRRRCRKKKIIIIILILMTWCHKHITSYTIKTELHVSAFERNRDCWAYALNNSV